MTHWVFGYGSLICPDSRARTGVTGEALPAYVRGFARHWSVALTDQSLSVLGVRRSKAASCTGGVLFALDDDAFTHFDAREAEYQRVRLTPEQIQLSGPDRALPEGDFWLYLPPSSTSPHPIPQSYLDVTLRGCLGLGEAFAYHFLENTFSWKPILNDRAAPRYVRPLRPEHQAVLPAIDRLLARSSVATETRQS